MDAMPRLNRSHTSRSDSFGLDRAAAFENSLADAVSFRFPFLQSLDGSRTSGKVRSELRTSTQVRSQELTL